MSRQKLQNRNIRKLTRVGRQSLCVVLPIEMVRKLKWKERQKVVIGLRGKTINIKDWHK